MKNSQLFILIQNLYFMFSLLDSPKYYYSIMSFISLGAVYLFLKLESEKYKLKLKWKIKTNGIN